MRSVAPPPLSVTESEVINHFAKDMQISFALKRFPHLHIHLYRSFPPPPPSPPPTAPAGARSPPMDASHGSPCSPCPCFPPDKAQLGGGGAAGEQDAAFKQELLVAVQTGDEEKLRHALKHLPSKAVNHVFPHPVSATALHVAAQNNSLELVNALLEVPADTGARDLRGKKYCPLHYAAQNGNVEVLQALLKAGADPNAKEGEFGRTSLHILAIHWKKNEDSYKACLDALLDCKRIKVDAHDSNKASPLFMAATKGWEYMVRKMINMGADTNAAVGNKTAADKIESKFPGLLNTIDLSVIQKPKRYFSDELYDALINTDLQLFQEILTEIDNSEEKSKVSALEEDHGECTLLQYACDNGLTDFVEELLKNGANPSRVDQISLMCPVLYAARNGYHRILELLLEALIKEKRELHKGILRHKDLRKETVLHKVVKREYADKKEGVNYYRCLQVLLKQKRFLDLDGQDEFGNTALHYAVLCDDQSFVRILLFNGAHLGIKNQFGTLAITRIQASVLKEVLNDCIKYKNNVADRDFEIILHYSMLAPAQTSQQPETECLRFLSDSRKHRHLLRHPVIDTFLFLKWQRIQKYYYLNVVAYTAFVILLTTYILIYHGTYMPSGENGIEREAQGRNISNKGDVQEVIMHNLVQKYVFKAFIFIFALYIAIREGVQFYVSWKMYVSRLENWLDVSVVVLTCTLIFVPIDAASLQSLCAWLVLISWIEFVLLLGRHPYLSIYITMFTTVTSNFLKFITIFSFVIVAFSISFYLVFQMHDSFTTYYHALLKTIAMTTGEIEYTDLPLDALPFSSHLLFVVFVFLIVLVLMNLLNGLAVSDIQEIRQIAEIVSYSSRVELVSYFESVFLASPLHQFIPESLRCCEGEEKDDCYFTTCIESHNPAMRLLNWLGRRTLMFQTCLRDPCISVFPNRGKDRWHVCDCHSFHLKESHIEAAKDVVLEKEHAVDTHRLSGLENRLDEVMSAIYSLTEKVNKHVLCPSPEHIRDLTGVTTDTFKHHLDKWLADIPDQPPTPGYSSSHDNTLPSVVLEARIRELHTTPGMSGGPPQLR
ncbi:Transient receptor potential cation channel protein painless [Chionoecetes opilio]|uniref:Transient receptor potential cation channel protein painless n=1 Tax=Chionoecetes opilio TaxID=41210 RepID=A0A8J4YM15_CHIOP|nr:Transient receptor potential cation channel protein painless [Chionoecetes opilio]